MANGEVSYTENWQYCVSTASSYMSTNWHEHYFVEEESANKFYETAKKKRLAVLIVDRENY